MKTSHSKEASESEMLKFHNLIKNGHPGAIAARDSYMKSSNKQQFHQDIIRICRSPGPTPAASPAGGKPQSQPQSQAAAPKEGNASPAPAATPAPARPAPASSNASTICRSFVAKGSCKFGDKCKFSHDVTASGNGTLAADGDSRNPEKRANPLPTELNGQKKKAVTAGGTPAVAASVQPPEKKEKRERGKKVSKPKPNSKDSRTASEVLAAETGEVAAAEESAEPESDAAVEQAGANGLTGDAAEEGAGDSGESDGNLRLRELLSSNSNNSPLLGGLGFGPTSAGIIGGLSALPPTSKDGEKSIYKGSKLSGNLDMEYFLAGMPGFQGGQRGENSFAYESFEIGRKLDSEPAGHAGDKSSLFRQGDTADSSPEHDKRNAPGSQPRMTNYPPGFHPDRRRDNEDQYLRQQQQQQQQQQMWGHHQVEAPNGNIGDSPKGQMPPPGMGFPPMRHPHDGYMEHPPPQGPFPGPGPYGMIDPLMFGMGPYGMMPMPMHHNGDHSVGDMPPGGPPFGPEHMGPYMMPPFYYPGMPMPPPHFMGMPPPHFMVPGPNGGYIMMPMYGGVPPPENGFNPDEHSGEAPSKPFDSQEPEETQDEEEEEGAPAPIADVDPEESIVSAVPSAPVVNTVKTNMLKSLLGKQTEPVQISSSEGLSTAVATLSLNPATPAAKAEVPESVVAEGAEMEDAVVPKKAAPTNFRVSKQSKGAEITMYLKPNVQNGRGGGGGQRGRFIPPGGVAHCNQAMTVQWQLPQSVMDECKRDGAALVIGLHRMGSSLNTSSVVSKKLSDSKGVVTVTASNGEKFSRGEMFFFAPKAAGAFVYRIFDNSSKEKSVNTLCTSSKFDVVISGRDVTTNLRYAYDLIKTQDSEIMGIVSLRTGILGMESPGVPANGDNPVELLNRSVDLLFSAISRVASSRNEESESKKLRAESIVEGDEQKAEEAAPAASAEHKARMMADKLNSECFDTMRALRQSQMAMSMLLPDQTRKLIKYLDFFCPVLIRFFESEQDLITARREKLGFLPAMFFGHRNAEVNRLAPQLVHNISACMNFHLHHLLPSKDYFAQREEARSRIESILNRSGVVSNDGPIRLAVFGSSRNGFGSVGADLDMCIVKDTSRRSNGSDASGSSVIESIAAALSTSGMEDVQARSTARIPIVLFCDSVSGIDCDISFTNPLALRNTELLQLYSDIDPRVRQLAFIVKHWAKQRQINSPMDGTLGSYAYILCLIHFLQTRSPPLLPSLQQLPPDWSPSAVPNQDRPLPKRFEEHPVDKSKTCDTYFYSAEVLHPGAGGREGVLRNLQLFASQNRQSCGELLIDFFAYYAWGFDYRHNTVSVRTGSTTISKIDKSEYCSWPQNDRLSIEDPFETWYDVGHVLKGPQMDYFRRELVRAYTVLTRFSQQPPSFLLSPNGANALGDELHKAAKAAAGQNGFEVDVISVLCDKAPDPPFSSAAKQAQQDADSA